MLVKLKIYLLYLRLFDIRLFVAKKQGAIYNIYTYNGYKYFYIFSGQVTKHP